MQSFAKNAILLNNLNNLNKYVLSITNNVDTSGSADHPEKFRREFRGTTKDAKRDYRLVLPEDERCRCPGQSSGETCCAVGGTAIGTRCRVRSRPVYPHHRTSSRGPSPSATFRGLPCSRGTVTLLGNPWASWTNCVRNRRRDSLLLLPSSFSRPRCTTSFRPTSRSLLPHRLARPLARSYYLHRILRLTRYPHRPRMPSWFRERHPGRGDTTPSRIGWRAARDGARRPPFARANVAERGPRQ